MSSGPNDPAFPIIQTPTHSMYYGFTKREMFAGMAMIGIIANPKTHGVDLYDDIATEALKCADAMLKACK